MTFAWPWALIGLLAIPLLVVGYRRLLRRQVGDRDRLAAQGLVLRGPSRERLRWLVPALLLGALTVMIFALARPVAAIAEPRREGTVVLAFDVSTSMGAKDVSPTRLDAAKAAANAFVEKQPSTIKIGVVAFGGTGLLAQQPTTDKAAVTAAIGRLKPSGETSLGRGILTSLGAIAGKPLVISGDTENGAGKETQLGYYSGTAIILLTDGENTGGPDPLDLADASSAAGVKIFPIGLGTAAGTTLQVDGYTLATHLDEPTLQDIAKTTGGTYYNATDAQALQQVYDDIELTWTSRTIPHEITAIVAAAASVLLLVGASIAVLRRGRVI